MCHGVLNIYCLDCSEMLTWRKEHLIRDDGYYDWRVVPSCGCGEVADPEIRALARAAHDEASVDDIFVMQERALEAVLGPELHAKLNSAMGGTDKRISLVREFKEHHDAPL